MHNEHVDILVIGSGLCGLAIAVTAARRGFTVRCVSKGGRGTSLANFGQWHSGAVYAPVLPHVAKISWEHSERWRGLIRPALVDEEYGFALFGRVDAVDRYRDAWRRIGIDMRLQLLDAWDFEYGILQPLMGAAHAQVFLLFVIKAVGHTAVLSQQALIPCSILLQLPVASLLFNG
jgi:glycine/D-amino acid oxidase-like deaminating enzyme